jgi:hypothetical protein
VKENEPPPKRYNWYYDVSGRRIDFIKGEQVSWGIELKIPIDSTERKKLKKHLSLVIPENIDHLCLLDMNPQESLPEKLRTFDIAIGDDEMGNLKTMFRGPSGRRVEIEDLFNAILGKNRREKKIFNSLISESRGREIVFIIGHSGDDPWRIGEQSDEFKGKRHGKNWGPFKQKPRNEVSVRTLLEYYNDSSKYAAILIAACYFGLRGPSSINVPVFYVSGVVYGSNSLNNHPPTEVVYPRKKKV